MSIKPSIAGAILCCASVSSVAQADTILGLYLSASAWSPDISGTIDSTGPRIDLNDTLGFSDDDAQRLSARLEHPVPVLPNIGLETYDLGNTSVATLNESIIYDGTVYNISDVVTSQLDMSHQSVLLYYELLDNWISLDLGLDIMVFDGLIALESSTNNSMTDIDETIPAIYGMLQFDFPATGFSVGGTVSFISYDDNDITKSRLYLGWESDIGLGLEVGVQAFDAEWQDISESNGNVSFDGMYTSLTYHF